MIIKERQYPLSAHILQALLRRLQTNHEKRKLIERDLAKVLAGYRGEQSLDYYLSFLDKDQYTVFHDVRLPLNNHYFQMDTLILTPHFIFILEVKNLFGSITFDPEFNQLIRIYNEVEEVFPDPVNQVNNQKFKLAQWLKIQGFTLPIFTKVIISNPQTIIKSNSNNRNYLQHISRSTNIVSEITKIAEKQPAAILSQKECKKITRQLLKEHTELHKNEMGKYQIAESELIPGIHCPNCASIPLIKKHSKWHCSNCSYAEKNAIIHSLFDYFLLLRPTITNAQSRRFLAISSTSISSKILSSMNLPRSGSTKGIVYHLTREYFDSKI